MAQKFYIDNAGAFLGSFDDGGDSEAVNPFDGETEVDTVPPHPTALWVTDAWVYDADAVSWVPVRQLQADMINEVRWQIERHVTQRELGMDLDTEADIDAVTYQLGLQYLQDIRDNDEATHPSDPDAAIAALEALVNPLA